jgi:hypothetical protein
LIAPDCKSVARKVLEMPDVTVYDDFLPQAAYDRLFEFVSQMDCQYINTQGRANRNLRDKPPHSLRLSTAMSALRQFRKDLLAQAPAGPPNQTAAGSTTVTEVSPAPQGEPQAAAAVNPSCLITVTNNTQAVLTLSHQSNERGDFMTNPAAALQPGGTTTFAVVQTPHDSDPKDQGCKGSVTYQVGNPVAAVWRMEWDNPVGKKNTARATLDPQTAGFRSLEQMGQGDENVPAAFTISGGVPGTPVVPPTDQPVLQSITIRPDSVSMASGGKQQFTATGRFSDGSSQNLTTAVAWSSSAKDVVSIDGSGLATAAPVSGTATITATDATSGVAASTDVTVGGNQRPEAPVLKSITISPNNASLVCGGKQQFTATGTFSDGSSQNLTTTAAWSSSAFEIVSIDNKGLAVAIPESGTATITATDATSGLTASTNVTVTAVGQADDKTKADMQAALNNKPPDKAALKKLVDERGGRALDDLVNNMPDPPDRAEITAAIEARFGVRMTNIDPSTGADDVAQGNKSIRQTYMTMLKVPEANVRNNPSLKQIERLPTTNFPFYDPNTKEAVVPAFRPDTPGNAVGNTTDRTINGKFFPAQLIDVEEDCKPNGTDTPKYLDWSTLHEVAHGVDDQKHVMDGKGGNAFAGWQKDTVHAVAVVAAAEFKYDVNYIEAVLKGATPATAPPAPAGTDAAKWEAQRKNAVEWCNAVRVGNELWDKGAESAKRAIGGRVYHESYPNAWVSYNLAARAKGITGYQFRANGEWYAELYAAFHTGKLKPSHPYAKWLQEVEQ